MSTYTAVTLPCPACGKTESRRLAESANAARHPAFREQVLAGTFMRFSCDACGQVSVVERELLYTDLPRGQLIGVFPSDRRAEGIAVERGFRTLVEQLRGEPGLRGEAPALVRVVFGYAELREKLVCADAGLDDRAIEALKLLLLARTGWVRAGARGLLLVAVEDGELVFEPVGVVVEGEAVRSRVPRAMARIDGALLDLLPVPVGSLWVSVARVG